jgi:Uma2 family endonuclease
MNAVLQLARHKLSVDDYHRMGEAGILAPDSRVELIEGEIIDMAPIGSQHAGVVNLLNRFFVRSVGDAGLVSIQNPVRLSNHTEPQPDVLVLRPRADDYRSQLPTAADVLLLIEVADSSAAYDSRVKIPLYARHGIPEVWLFDLTAQQLEIYTIPGSTGYGQRRRLGKDDIAVATLLPPSALPLKDIWPV